MQVSRRPIRTTSNRLCILLCYLYTNLHEHLASSMDFLVKLKKLPSLLPFKSLLLVETFAWMIDQTCLMQCIQYHEQKFYLFQVFFLRTTSRAVYGGIPPSALLFSRLVMVSLNHSSTFTYNDHLHTMKKKTQIIYI